MRSIQIARTAENKFSALIVIIFFAAMSIVSTATASYAEAGLGDALKAFGLIGTWSRNCALPVGTLGSSRIAFNLLKDGRATFTTAFTAVLLSGHQVQVGSVFEIKNATLVSGKQIKLIGKTSEVICPGCINTSHPDTSLRQIIIEKTGTQIHIVDNRLLDGSSVAIDNGVMRGTGQPTPLDSKCDAEAN